MLGELMVLKVYSLMQMKPFNLVFAGILLMYNVIWFIFLQNKKEKPN